MRIVCLGDSHTFGVGTSTTYAYPQQLEKILNMNNPAQKFSVVNLGVPGSNTKDQVRTIDAFFKKNDAQVVLWLTGRNNADSSKQWSHGAIACRMLFSGAHLRSVRFFKKAWDGLTKGKPSFPSVSISAGEDPDYVAYLNFYLEQGRALCRSKGSKLILLSYYNSSSSALQTFASDHHIPYFDFTVAFKIFSRKWQDTSYISPDQSHMNRYGYKFFTEQLYTDLFLHPAATGFKIGPLVRRIETKDFYSNAQEKGKLIALQEARAAQCKGSPNYPFELIHLGHIFSEVGDNASAMKYYMDGLIASQYADNRMIVTPVVNGYLKVGQNDKALKICEEILLHNPANLIAKYYRDMLLEKATSFSKTG